MLVKVTIPSVSHIPLSQEQIIMLVTASVNHTISCQLQHLMLVTIPHVSHKCHGWKTDRHPKSMQLFMIRCLASKGAALESTISTSVHKTSLQYSCACIKTVYSTDVYTEVFKAHILILTKIKAVVS